MTKHEYDALMRVVKDVELEYDTTGMDELVGDRTSKVFLAYAALRVAHKFKAVLGEMVVSDEPYRLHPPERVFYGKANRHSKIREALKDIEENGGKGDWEATVVTEGGLYDPKLRCFALDPAVRSVTKIPYYQGVIVNWDEGPIKECDLTEEQKAEVKEILK